MILKSITAAMLAALQPFRFGADGSGSSGKTGALGKAGLAEGTNAATIKTTNIVDFAIDGVAYRKAVTDNIAVTAHAQQAASTSCLYLVQIDNAGTVSTKKGNEELTADLGVTRNLQWPQPDDGKCPLGGYRIALDNATTFTNGTTDIGAAGVTSTFYDFAGGIPLAPQVA